jgi:uncharacterized protein YggU (UPF0235/DUF167 family)
MAGAWRRQGEGVVVHLRLTPKAARDAVEGCETLADGREVLKARVRAVPEDGKANEAARKLLARALGLPASKVSLESGATARLKSFYLAGDPAGIESGLAALAAGPK